MLTVGRDGAAVNRDLLAGLVRCPECGGVLGPWGWAARRSVWAGLDGREGPGVAWRPRRARCRSCRRTQVLLPAGLLSRRCDSAAVIASALEASASGWGYRRAAAAVGRPESTVRGWLSAARRVAGRAQAGFAGVLALVAPDAAAAAPGAESGVAGFVGACAGLAAGLAQRWRQVRAGWLEVAAAACRCQVLCAGWWAQHGPALPLAAWPAAVWPGGP